MKVPIKLKKSNTLMGIEVTTSNPTETYLPITHQLLGTMRIFLMEVEIIKVKDQLKTINRITFHLDSKDKIEAIQGQKIKCRRDHHHLKIKY